MPMDEKNKGRNILIAVLFIDLAFVLAIAFAFYFYGTDYQDKIENQNLTDITNVNRSSANVSSIYFQSQQTILADAVTYVTTHGFTSDETLNYCCESNSGNKSFELIGTGATGYAAVRQGTGFTPVDYTSPSYREFAKIFTTGAVSNTGEAPCTQEFTDELTARKSFAFYSQLTLPDATGAQQNYTLLLVMDSAKISTLIDLDGGYDEMPSVIANKNGDYIFGSNDFKSDNLFRYFYVFNDLSLDQERDYAASFAANSEGCFWPDPQNPIQPQC
jgi:hypothetical protein